MTELDITKPTKAQITPSSSSHNNVQKLICIRDFEENAISKLPTQILGYYNSGADQQITLRQNAQMLQNIRIMPRVLTDLRGLSLKTHILGYPTSIPFGIAPTAMHKLIQPQGEKVAAEVAKQCGTCITLSNLSTVPLSQFAKSNGSGIRFMQIYILKSITYTQRLVEIAKDLGFSGLVLTVDTPVFGKRVLDKRNQFSPKNFQLQAYRETGLEGLVFANDSTSPRRQSFIDNIEAGISWDIIKWLRKLSPLPIILKGIVSVQDALCAMELGVDAIWISNHGGRQLDTSLPTCVALSSIHKALQDHGNTKMQVFVDGGVRKGTDIFKMLALGADFVFVGRPCLYGLVEGKAGLSKVMDILADELKRTMQLAGTRKVEQITRDFISTERCTLIKTKL